MSQIDNKILQSLNAQLSARNKEMELLLARVAHELFTPITSLLLVADGLLDQLDPTMRDVSKASIPKQLLPSLEKITKNSVDIKDQIVNILHFFRESSPQKTIVNLSQTIETVLKKFKTNINVIKHCPEDLQLETLQHELELVLENLLSNAIKFTEANKQLNNKSILIEVVNTSSHIEISIVDTGIGMPEDFDINTWSLGQRGSLALEKEIKGYGIGLVTAKKLVGLLNGTIQYLPSNEGASALVKIPKENHIDTI
jgi:signal transduction histidine kinase